MSAALRRPQLTDEDVDRIADRVVAKLRLVPALPVSPPAHYTTNKRGPHVPGKSRRWMLDHLHEIPGAHKVGRDWVVASTDYEVWATRDDLRKCAPRKVPPAPVHTAPKKLDLAVDPADLHARAERALAAAGLRPTK